MLEVVEVRNRQGSVLSLPLEDEESGYIVENIDGLDPVKATLVSSGYAQLDGAQYQSSRREARNIKFRLGLDPTDDETSVQDLRRRLYDYFMPKTESRLRFRMHDGYNFDIYGRIESLETALFSKDPAVDISLLCFDPDFYDPEPVLYEGASTSSQAEVTLHYDGTVEPGFLFTMFVNRATNGFTLYHRPPDGTLRTLQFGADLIAGDLVKINTQIGSKSAVRTRNGVDSPVLWGMTPQSTWLELQPGDNHFRAYVEGADIPYNIRYTNKYGGL